MLDVSLILFDIDGTLVDHEAAAGAAVVAWLTGAGWASAEECLGGLTSVWEEVAERHFPAWRTGEISFEEQRRRRLREFLPLLKQEAAHLSPAELDRIFADYLVHYEAHWRAYPDVVDCLQALTGYRLAVFSNGDQQQQADKIERSGLSAWLGTVLTAGGLGLAKPSPEAFHAACASLGVEPAHALYVGDNLEVDARGAAQAGLRSVWLNRNGAAGEHHPSVATLRDLPTLISGH